jgi:hypothetical protein
MDASCWQRGADGAVTAGLDLASMTAERAKLSDYNFLLLDQFELFCATNEDIAAFCARTNSSSRLVTGQVGLRCIHCSKARTFPGRREVLFNGLHHLVKVSQIATVFALFSQCYRPPSLTHRLSTFS